MFELCFNANLKGLIEELKKYNTERSIFEFVNDFDLVSKFLFKDKLNDNSKDTNNQLNKNNPKLSSYKKIMDEKTRKKEEEAAALKAKIFKIKIITTIILSITSLILFVVGIILRINNIDGEILTLLGFFPLIAIAVMWFTTQK